jgi:hypothetical protein
VVTRKLTTPPEKGLRVGKRSLEKKDSIVMPDSIGSEFANTLNEHTTVVRVLLRDVERLKT